MWLWLFVKLIAFSGFTVILCLVFAIGTVSYFSHEDIDRAYEREVAAIRKFSIGLDPERRLPCERRGVYIGNYVGNAIDAIGRQRPPSRVSDAVDKSWYVLANEWWEDTKPKLKRFMPLAYIRIETYQTIYLTSLGLYLFAYFLGEHYARIKIRAGVHKTSSKPAWILFLLRTMASLSVACTGIVTFLPVVYWVIPGVLLSCLIVSYWRAHSIQGVFITPGKG
jgi:hypothetical protein